jgi:hypothetical protein
MGNTAKRSIISGDLNLPYADWNGHAEVSREPQASLNRLVWEYGYMQVVNRPTRGDVVLDVYLVVPKRSFNSCCVVQGISLHCGMLFEVE